MSCGVLVVGVFVLGSGGHGGVDVGVLGRGRVCIRGSVGVDVVPHERGGQAADRNDGLQPAHGRAP